MDFNLSEQEKMVQGLARDFAAREVRPQAEKIDRSGEFPLDLVRKMGRQGFRGLPFPVEYGGGGAGYVSYVLALEQICQASLTAGAVIAINTVPEEALLRFGNDEQKKTLLAPLARGDLLGGIAFTEAETGSDPGAIQTAARKSSGGYVLNGQKHFVSQAAALDLVLTFARREGKGLNAFLLDAASPGFTVREPCATMGLRGLGVAVVYLEDVFVPRERLLGAEGQGFDILLEAISLGRLGVAVEGVAVAQAAFDQALEYARQKKAMGKKLVELPTIQWHLAEMAAKVPAARWLAYHTAFQRDRGQSIRSDSAAAKLFASQVAVEVTSRAMQVAGSYGAMTSMPFERFYRDAKMTEIYVGISELQRSIIAQNLI